MKYLMLIIVATGLMLAGCSDSTEESDDLLGDWERQSDFEGVSRSGAVQFTVNNRVFVGTGFDGSDRLKDFWEYDAGRNTWFRRADFPGTARNGAVAFAAGQKGYVGLGFDGTNRLKDFWEYDVATDRWTPIADFANGDINEPIFRYGAIATGVGNVGFVGAGYGATTATGGGNDLKDWWQYDPAQQRWIKMTSIGGSKRSNAFVFVINEQIYVGGGINNGSYQTDFWRYDPQRDAWTELNPLDDEDDEDFDYALQRELASTFVVNGYGYLVGGNTSALLTSVWEYDVTADEWTEKTEFEGTAREAAVGFSVNGNGYITTGRNGTSLRFDDLWRFDPFVENDGDE